MKYFTLIAMAGAVLLSGCATTSDSALAKGEESYTPLGTAIPRKNPSRMDNVTILDKQALENDRAMGNAGREAERK